MAIRMVWMSCGRGGLGGGFSGVLLFAFCVAVCDNYCQKVIRGIGDAQGL
jgi:hypothetical protein